MKVIALILKHFSFGRLVASEGDDRLLADQGKDDMQNHLNRRQSGAYKEGFCRGIYRREDSATDLRTGRLSSRQASEFLRGYKEACRRRG